MQLLAYTPSLRGELILDGGRLQKPPQLPDQFAYVSGMRFNGCRFLGKNKNRFQDGEFHLKIVDPPDAVRANWIKSARP
jgi:hypothetical protein